MFIECKQVLSITKNLYKFKAKRFKLDILPDCLAL